MSDVAPVEPEPVTTLHDRYRIGPVIGVGATSTVYRAHDPLLNRDVAVKVFAADAALQSDIQTQRAEARMVASLNHHSLATLFDAGIDHSDPRNPQSYIVMEYVPGSDLRQRLESGALSPALVTSLGIDLAEGLAYVHAAGFVHHDVKPANVLLGGGDPVAGIRGKLTDFGISATIGDLGSAELTGTAAYLSPEQVEGSASTPASDVYALGLVLLEAVTGHLAFPGRVEESAFARLKHQPDIPDWLPDPLADVIRRMTARDPRRRISAGEVARVLRGDGSPLLDARVTDDRTIDHHERERLDAVHRYEIVDPPADDAFDVITRLTTRMLAMPMAVVSIVDSDRVWFLSTRGLEPGHIDRNEVFFDITGRARSRAWNIVDLADDERLRDHPLVAQEPHIRSYAAAPLITHDGFGLGALCVFGRRPHRFTAADLENLTDLAALVMRELELRLASRRALFFGPDRAEGTWATAPNRARLDRAASSAPHRELP